jgi:hypothetical protein
LCDEVVSVWLCLSFSARPFLFLALGFVDSAGEVLVLLAAKHMRLANGLCRASVWQLSGIKLVEERWVKHQECGERWLFSV